MGAPAGDTDVLQLHCGSCRGATLLQDVTMGQPGKGRPGLISYCSYDSAVIATEKADENLKCTKADFITHLENKAEGLFYLV